MGRPKGSANYNRMTLDKFLSRLIHNENGCWINPTKTNTVWVDGEAKYIIPEILSLRGKGYNGKVIRTCGTKRCFNPDHLLSPTREELFWSNVNIRNDDECWEWIAGRNIKNYGMTSLNGKFFSSHRLAYELTNGEIPDGMCVCHRCDNPPCCNPKHLFLGTQQDNVDDRERKGRNTMPLSKGEDHGLHKLLEKDVREIRRIYGRGEGTYRSLADRYGVTFSAIRDVIKGKNWGWLK